MSQHILFGKVQLAVAWSLKQTNLINQNRCKFAVMFHLHGQFRALSLISRNTFILGIPTWLLAAAPMDRLRGPKETHALKKEGGDIMFAYSDEVIPNAFGLLLCGNTLISKCLAKSQFQSVTGLPSCAQSRLV